MAADVPIIRRLNCQLGFEEKLTKNKKNWSFWWIEVKAIITEVFPEATMQKCS